MKIYFVPLVIKDNESSLKTKAVLEYCYLINVYQRNLHPRTGHLADPCDNPIHGIVHKVVNHELDTLSIVGSPSFRECVGAYLVGYNSLSIPMVIGFMLNSGLIGKEDPRSVMTRLFSEGLHPNSRFNELHLKQLEAHLDDLIIRGDVIPQTPYTYRFLGAYFDLYYKKLDLEEDIIRLRREQ